MKRLFKITLWIFASLLLIIIGTAIFSQTQIFRDWLRDKIVATANEQLNGELAIRRIEGNLIRHFTLHDNLLTQAQDTVLHLPKLTVRFDWRKLLDNEILLNVVALDSPLVKLTQNANNEWAVQNLTKPSEEDSTEFDWLFRLEKARLSGGRVFIQTPPDSASQIPTKLEGLDAILSLTYASEKIDVMLDSLNVQAFQPFIDLKKLAFNAVFQDSLLLLNDIVLRLAETEISGSASAKLAAAPAYHLDLEAARLNFQELGVFYPDAGLHGSPSLKMSAVFQGDSLTATARLQENEQSFFLDALVREMSGAPNYEGVLQARAFELSHWLPSSETVILNGNLTFDGAGFSPDSLDCRVSGTVWQSNVFERQIDSLRISGGFEKGDTDFELAALGAFGGVELKGAIQDVFQKQIFEIDGDFHDLNLAELLLADSLQTDLNTSLHATGRSFDPEKINADATIRFSSSELFGAEIDTIFCNLTANKDDFSIDTLHVDSQIGALNLAGLLSLSSENKLRFRADLKDLHWVKNQMSLDTLRAGGVIDGRIHGRFDALGGEVDLDLHEVTYNTFSVGKMQGRASFFKSPDTLSGTFFSQLQQAGSGENLLDSVRVDSKFHLPELNIGLELADSALAISGRTTADILLDSIVVVKIPEFNFAWQDLVIEKDGREAHVVIEPERYKIENLTLRSGDQKLKIRGVVAPEGEQKLTAQISNIHVADLMQRFDGPEDFLGVLDLDVNLNGRLDNPEIDAEFRVVDGRFSEFKYDQLQIGVQYEDKKLVWDYILYQDQSRNINGDGWLPFDPFAPEDVSMFNADCTFYFQTDAYAPGLDLSFLQAFTNEVKEVGGKFFCDVVLENTFRDPRPRGNLRIVSGAFNVPATGANYKDMQVTVNFTRDTVRVLDFEIGTEVMTRYKKSTRGRFYIDRGSFAVFDSTSFWNGLQTAQVNLKADNFLAINTSNYRARIGADIRMFGDLDAPKFDGTLTILRSSVFYPALEESGLYDETPESSLLSQILGDTLRVERDESAVTGVEESYMEKLRGSLRIDIPRNTWLRGPDLNIELSGRLDLVKNGPEFEQPFGTISVLRGTYDFLTAYQFTIKEGELIFEGGDEFNPRINLKAERKIRVGFGDSRERKALEIPMTGRMFQPEFTYALNGQDVDATNAASYLVLGRPASKSEGGGNVDALSAQGLGSILASQFLRSVGTQLSLDQLDISGSTLDDASIVVGKYLTDRLYVGFQQSIGSETDGYRTKVTLEYEMLRQILLQGTYSDGKGARGLDLIWRFVK